MAYTNVAGSGVPGSGVRSSAAAQPDQEFDTPWPRKRRCLEHSTPSPSGENDSPVRWDLENETQLLRTEPGPEQLHGCPLKDPVPASLEDDIVCFGAVRHYFTRVYPSPNRN